MQPYNGWSYPYKFWSSDISTKHGKLRSIKRCEKIMRLLHSQGCDSGDKKFIVILLGNGMSKKYENCKRQNSVLRLTYPEKEI